MSKIKSQNRKNRKPKKISERYLQNAGLHYLQRFAASRNHFKTVMARKIKRSCMAHPDQDYETCMAMLDPICDRFEEAGLLNDELYARGMVQSLRRSGKSARAITTKLRQKGLQYDLIQEKLGEVDAGQNDEGVQPDFQAALKLAKKRSLGPFKKDGEEEDFKKSLAILARAGFSFDIATEVLKLERSDLSS